MDHLPALDSLVKITSAILTKLQKLDSIAEQELQSAKDYKKSLIAFSKDLEDLSVKLKTILYHGDRDALAVLLATSDGDGSFRHLSDALKSAKILLKKQDHATDDLIEETEKSHRRSHLNFVALLSDVDADNERFKSRLGEANSIIDDSRADVKRCFEQFHALYTVHRDSPRSPSLVVSPSASRRREDSRSPGPNPRSSIQASFYDQPFNVVVGESYALEIADHLGILPSDGDPYTSTMKDMAERWVDDRVSEASMADIGRAQIELITNLRSALDAELAAFATEGPSVSGSGPEAVRCAHLFEIRDNVEKELMRDKTKTFSIAFCGMVKAGKSLFLNALMGRMLLPSDELPSTAWPCRVRHVKGQQTPNLDIDAAYFQNAIDSLQRHHFGAMMENYRPPKDSNIFAAILDDIPDTLGDSRSVGTDEQALKLMTRKREVYKNWIDLHPTTKSNLLRFEKAGYRIPERASGEEHVLDLLAQVNDVIRLCRRLNVELPKERPRSWPLLEIEFEALRDEKFEGDFEFIDLPGIGESHNEFHSFEDLIKRVAKEVNAVIPIVSFKEVSKDDWRQQLPELIKSGLGRPPELVLCTHLDQVVKDRVEQQVASVAKAFWPKHGDAQRRVLRCSSRMGMSARALLRLSMHGKPVFKDIWIANSIEYDCAEKILGAHKSELTFQNLDAGVWKKAVEEQLGRSELQESIKRIVTDMVMSSHHRTLMEEGARLSKQLHKAITNQHRKLLTMRRSEEEREKAYAEFEEVRQKYQEVLGEWSLNSSRNQLQSTERFQAAYKRLEPQGRSSASLALENTVKSIKGSPAGRQRIETTDEELTFHSVSTAEMFLQQVQIDLNRSLSKLKRDFVSFVRRLANMSREEHFASLRSKIQVFISNDVQAELKEEIIDELNERGATVETLTLSSIRRKMMHTVATSRFRVSLVARDDREAIPEAFTGGERQDVEYEQLGFMLRAPIAVIAAVPWLLGSAIWPFMKRTEKLVLNKQAFLEELDNHVIRPFFDALQQEGQTTLEEMMVKSSDAARNAVKDALAMEEQRYERDPQQRPTSTAAVALTVGTLLNFIASEAALLKLQKYLKGIPAT
ncbi:Clamp-binding protein CrfC [Grifola frondosa]|uniref:Clamp-binding protein CrfC n=1 Tax=Grifola frondosa TaxID=5627 RepID=A0A1C7LR79_GRIFR|nr:Clamp-binding protein CrfC [Grifola frondosa]